MQLLIELVKPLMALRMVDPCIPRLRVTRSAEQHLIANSHCCDNPDNRVFG